MPIEGYFEVVVLVLGLYLFAYPGAALIMFGINSDGVKAGSSYERYKICGHMIPAKIVLRLVKIIGLILSILSITSMVISTLLGHGGVWRLLHVI